MYGKEPNITKPRYDFMTNTFCQSARGLCFLEVTLRLENEGGV